MWLIVGLGNPGSQYAFTRHNIGFMALDYFAKSLGAENWKIEHKAEVIKIKTDDIPLILAKPQTYMNRSGESVQSLLSFYKIPIENLIVLHDELDQKFAQMKINKNRGHGGHNGIRSITELIGSADYARVRLGIGRPPHPEMGVADYVLQKFSQEEFQLLPEFLNKSGDAIESIIHDGIAKASTKFNS